MAPLKIPSLKRSPGPDLSPPAHLCAPHYPQDASWTSQEADEAPLPDPRGVREAGASPPLPQGRRRPLPAGRRGRPRAVARTRPDGAPREVHARTGRQARCSLELTFVLGHQPLERRPRHRPGNSCAVSLASAPYPPPEAGATSGRREGTGALPGRGAHAQCPGPEPLCADDSASADQVPIGKLKISEPRALAECV